MERVQRELIEEQRYQKFLEYERQEIVGPLGQRTVQALFAPIGIAVSRFETVLPVERYVAGESLPEKLTRPMGDVSIRELVQLEQDPDIHDPRVFKGYGTIPETYAA